MSGHCDACDRHSIFLVLKGKRWLCRVCLGREL